MPPQRWTDVDFERMSWHDNHVHALRIVEGECGAGELILDLDYILEWVCDNAQCQFRILPAELRFREVKALSISIEYAKLNAVLGPFSISEIKKCSAVRERYVAQLWSIELNSPEGMITFEAVGYEQTGTSPSRLSDTQYLAPRDRACA
jgi:hypothetical protein